MPGHIEIFRVHDSGYYKAFLDGKDASVIYKGDLADCISHRKWRREQVAASGVANEDALQFTHYDLAFSKEKAARDTDDFDDYLLCKNTILKERIKPEFKNWTLDQFEDSNWC